MKTKKVTQTSDAPEGGWGWFVVLGYSMNNMVVVPLIQVFTLLYQDVLLTELQMTGFEVNAIIAVNCSFGMFLGIFNGPFLRFFGYRKTAILGAVLIFLGSFCTSRADAFWQFIIFYGIFVSCGMNMVMSSFNLALNTYFVVKRGIATGIAMAITGIGPIVMPLLVSFLMELYGIRDGGMILSSITLHSLAAAMFLQPVKRHKKKIRNVVSKENNMSDGTKEADKEPGKNSNLNNEVDPNTKNELNSNSKNELDEDVPPDTKLMENSETVEISLRYEEKVDSNEEEKGPPLKSLDDVVKKHKMSICERITRFFDFDLLCDPVYVNIAFGLSLAFVGEMNFSLILPIALKKRGFEDADVAKFLSLLAFADICSRFISPFIGQSIRSKVRFVYLFSLTSGFFFRICLLHSYTFFSLTVVIIGLGLTKGIRSVYTALVIPSYVPLHKLASATGLQMVNNGLLYFIFGPLIGLLTDLGDFNIWIYSINCLTLCTIIMWFTELFLIRKRKNKRKTPIVIKTER